MPRGGRRPGAGRKVGSKDRYDKEIAAAAAETGQTPLDIMLHVARTALLPGRRSKVSPQLQLYAAKEAAAYCHAKLQAIAISAPPRPSEKSILEMTNDERLDLARRFALVLELGKRASNDLAPSSEAAEIRQLPHRPQPEPEPRVERPAPVNEYAIEPLRTTWPAEVWERAACVRLNQIPAAYQPEGAFEVRGSKPRFVLTESPDAWRRRVAGMGYNLAAA